MLLESESVFPKSYQNELRLADHSSILSNLLPLNQKNLFTLWFYSRDAFPQVPYSDQSAPILPPNLPLNLLHGSHLCINFFMFSDDRACTDNPKQSKTHTVSINSMLDIYNTICRLQLICSFSLVVVQNE